VGLKGICGTSFSSVREQRNAPSKHWSARGFHLKASLFGNFLLNGSEVVATQLLNAWNTGKKVFKAEEWKFRKI